MESVFIFPFILLGRFIAKLRPLKQEYETFYFFPFYHTGGAEKVHLQIVQATGNKRGIIFFTRYSYDNNFIKGFEETGCTIRDISGFTDRKVLYILNLIYRGIVTAYINNQRLKPVVFNGQCNFGYKISPWISRSIPQVELIHSFNTFSWIRLPYLQYISQTVMISKLRINNHLEQYTKLLVPFVFRSKIRYIINGIHLPARQTIKDYNGEIQILYVGRGTEEKRIHLIAQMAERSHRSGQSASFVFMGDVENAIPKLLLPYCRLLGHKTNPDEINEVYEQSHIVIITSSTEGFPLAIEEGMARGCAVMATPVGDVGVHVKNVENGWLFTSITDEVQIVEEALEFLDLCNKNKKPLQEMSLRNYSYAKTHFGMEQFEKSYKELFRQLRNELK